MKKRKKERLLLAVVSVIIILMAWTYKGNLKKQLAETANAYLGDTASVVNLAYPLNEEGLKTILVSGDYFSDKDYSDFVVKKLQEKLRENNNLRNLGALNKRSFMIESQAFEQAGSLGKERLKISQYNMGLDSTLMVQESTSPIHHESVVSISQKPTGIRFHGRITTSKDEKSDKNPVEGVLVLLTQEYTQSYKNSVLDSVIANFSEDSLKTILLSDAVLSPVYYARTDSEGKYSFENLERGKNYSVVPVKPGKEYGGVTGAASVTEHSFWEKLGSFNPLTKDKYEFNFSEREHKLRLFDNSTYQKIKNDKIFTVRTPETFNRDFLQCITLFLLSFWGFHAVLSIKKSEGDNYILPIILLLTGLGLIVLYSIQDPLRDEVFGKDMAIYTSVSMFLLSVIALLLSPQKLLKVLSFDYVTNLHDRGFKLPKWFIKINNPSIKSRGYLWLILSILLMIVLQLFGSGPEGSGVKVNLGPIQVSEIAKYLMILFFAKYFTANLEYFKRIPNNKWLLLHNLKMLVFFLGLIALYIVLGDLGPALVVCAVFLVFYSFAKNEFLNMILTALLFGMLLYIVFNVYGGKATSIFAVFICIGLGFYTFWIRKKNESSFFLILLISAFSVLEIIPLSPFKRLSDRNGMFHNIWHNELNGGDQIAQGVWSLASGGWTGQGLGNGSSNVMPAYHTDMIFQSIGEELGLFTLVIILVAFGFLLFRSMLAARNTGKVLLFYFIGGIAMATTLQLAIIIGGSLGLIPLTGISVPFLSKGNSGLLINIFFFGIVLMLSGIKGSKNESIYVNKTFDSVNGYSVLTFIGIILIFCIRLVFLQLNANSNMIKPSLVLTKQGEWQYSVNPRIKIIGKELKAGNIYDRNGILLATSDKKEFLDAESQLKSSDGRLADFYKKQKFSRQSRYYPFSENLVYWLGDVNTQLVTSENVGYVAEFRHYSDLRGLNAESIVEQYSSTKFREEKYLPVEDDKKTTLIKYDYSSYIPYLRAGKNSNKIRQHNDNAKDRAIRLSLDVNLQNTIGDLINAVDYKNYLVSVVVIKPDDGQVLASVSNPKPNYDDLERLRGFNPKYYNKLMNTYFGYSHHVADRDLAIFKQSVPGSTIKILDAVASFKRFGRNAESLSFYVDPKEIIRGDEPNNEHVNLKKAIVKSSNVYFIKLMNEKNLHPELFEIYNSVGISLYHKGGFYISKPKSYNTSFFHNYWLNKLSYGKENYYNEKLENTASRLKQSDYSWIAWGQGPVEASPLQLARIIGGIANGGNLMPSTFIFDSKKKVNNPPTSVLSNEYVSVLDSYLKEQDNTSKLRTALQLDIKGKTGSPERNQVKGRNKKGEYIFKKTTDGWYTFYVENSKYDNSPIAFAIRIEEKGGSGHAVRLATRILNALKRENYFNTSNNQRI